MGTAGKGSAAAKGAAAAKVGAAAAKGATAANVGAAGMAAATTKATTAATTTKENAAAPETSGPGRLGEAIASLCCRTHGDVPTRIVPNIWFLDLVTLSYPYEPVRQPIVLFSLF